jgi:cytochrome c biogenesis protein CcmG, thiol:disulfide interchange protein DsbE
VTPTIAGMHDDGPCTNARTSAMMLAVLALATPVGCVNPASLRGEPAAINFWASWCEPCREEAPALERLARSLGGRAQIVGVNWNDSSSGARSWIEKYGWTFPNLRDGEGAVGRDYGLRGLPTTFIIDPHGRIADVLPGPQSESSLREALESAGCDLQ